MPCRLETQHALVDWTVRDVRAWQIAEAHQKLADDLAAGEAERLLEQLDPRRLGARMVRVEPMRERAVAGADRLQPLRVLDHRLDLEPVADNAGVAEQPADVARAEARDLVDVVGREGAGERSALLQHREPRQAGLVDLEREALEQHRVVTRRKAVFAV